MPGPPMRGAGWPALAIRARGADPIDWIEQIPFSETRNYVQRVLENTEVYRVRLAGKDHAAADPERSLCAGDAAGCGSAERAGRRDRRAAEIRPDVDRLI